MTIVVIQPTTFRRGDLRVPRTGVPRGSDEASSLGIAVVSFHWPGPAAESSGASTDVVQLGRTHRAVARDHQEDEMPARKTTRKTAADTGTKVRVEELAAADSAAAATTSETAVGAADVTRGEDEAAAAVTFSAFSDAVARRGARDAAEGAAAISMADQLAASGELAAALSTDEFRRGMELAGIAGQVQLAAELLQGVRQPTLAAFLGRMSHQLHVLAVDALSRATEGAIVAHGAEHLADELAALGLTEMGEGRDEYATSEALGAASAEMAAELAAAKAMGGVAQALANDGADRAVRARGADQGPPGKAAAAVTPRTSKPATRAATKRAPRTPSKPKT
jgi:hypothetical protein